MNKIEIGRGTMKEFADHYTNINSVQGQKAIASNIFPLMNDGYNKLNDNSDPLYEWVIWFESIIDNRQINKESGKVENKGTLSNPITEKDDVGQKEMELVI